MPQASIAVQIESPNEEPAIFAINAAAFPTDAEARLVEALRAGGHLTISLVAIEGDRIVGHVAFSPVSISSEPENHGGIGLGPVAVLPDFQNRGVGSQLIRAGLEACRVAGYTYAVVLGAPTYYSRFGFSRASGAGLGNQYGVDDEFMAMPLIPGGLPSKPGMISYSTEFALTE